MRLFLTRFHVKYIIDRVVELMEFAVLMLLACYSAFCSQLVLFSLYLKE